MRQDGDVDWSALPKAQPGLRCVIVIPARDEAALLPRALQAIADQRGIDFLYEVIVLANNCSDDTAARARAFAQCCQACAVHVAEVSWPAALANVGRARRALMEIASHRLGQATLEPAVILSTDADTRVADDWLCTNVAAIDAGADAVGGRIIAEADDALPPAARRLMRLDDRYRTWRTRLECLLDPDPLDPWPRHHHHFGASLAVRADAYRAVGGLPLVPYLEDEALVRALRLQDRTIRHCPHVRVQTSTRLEGRVEVGLSWQLRAWSSHAAAEGYPMVTHPMIEFQRWALRGRARALWRELALVEPGHPKTSVSLAALAMALQIDVAALAALATNAASFAQLWDELEAHGLLPGPASTAITPTVPMDQALEALRRMVRSQLSRQPP